ncbi:MAG: hypothetical protein IKB04_07515 [Clostridia bacterium]|nr:hypothetical protein [Clostridia bacterium]
MIKGVSRQILEVTHTGNPCFERAFLVVSPSFADRPPERLQHEAQRVLQAQKGYSGLLRARRWRRCKLIALVLLSGMLGVIVERILLTLL